MRHKLLTATLLFCATLFVLGCKNGSKTNSSSQEEENQGTEQITETQNMKETLAFNPDSVAAEPVFDIVTTMGTIRIQLYKETPKHRDNFVKLASERFYDGVLFHRVINGFMIQAGDPTTKDSAANPASFGRTDAGYKIPAEILPAFSHEKGALAAAREGDRANPEKKSSSSQFYLVQDPNACRHLDGEYTIFGKTLSGFDIIDAIAAVKVNDRDLPQTPVKILHINLVQE